MPFIVDITLYTGDHVQSKPIDELHVAKAEADDFIKRTMVEHAIVIDVATGEVKHSTCNPAAVWRAA